MVANPRYLMNRFMTGVSKLVEEECHIAMLVNDINISRIIVFAQQLEKSKLKMDKKRITIESEKFDGHGRSKN